MDTGIPANKSVTSQSGICLIMSNNSEKRKVSTTSMAKRAAKRAAKVEEEEKGKTLTKEQRLNDPRLTQQELIESKELGMPDDWERNRAWYRQFSSRFNGATCDFRYDSCIKSINCSFSEPFIINYSRCCVLLQTRGLPEDAIFRIMSFVFNSNPMLHIQAMRKECNFLLRRMGYIGASDIHTWFYCL